MTPARDDTGRRGPIAESRSAIGTLRLAARRSALAAQRVRPMWPEGFCLITGSPRSGTSAMRAWLMAQRGVASFYESRALIAIHRFLEEADRFKDSFGPEESVEEARRLAWSYYGSRRVLIGKRLLVDKEPLEPVAFPDADYAAFLRNVRRLFPRAKVIFMVRDPHATIWSMRQRTWGKSLAAPESRTYSLEECIDIWNGGGDLALSMADDPNVYVCLFERLIAEPEAESRRLGAFLGLDSVRTFVPRSVRTPAFDEGEREVIAQRTGQRFALLHQQHAGA